MSVICAFSSDSRELYKADIYRVLALPKGHIVHFRYKKKYVDNSFLAASAKLKDETVAIFFTHGNEQGKETQLSHISVRWATISNFEISDETDVFHAYLKLGEFCNVTVDSTNLNEKQPPTKFFTKLNCTKSIGKDNWQSRVNAIKNYFSKITFFYLRGIYKGKKKQSLKYQCGKSCHYDLVHGDKYILKLSIGNPDISKTKIEISDSSGEITINCINPIETSVQFDDFDIPVSVKTLQMLKQASLLTFKPIETGKDLGEYATNVELSLNLSLKRPFAFGVFSTCAFWALLLARPLSSSATWPNLWVLVFASLLFGASTGMLFFWFNKK